MTASYGAHEVMELHEVLTDAINDINTLQLYRPHAQDQQLASMLDRQLQFAVQEYNTLVQTASGTGMQHAVPYRAPKMTTPSYGLHQPGPYSPNMSANEVDDRDVSSAALCIHKAAASKKMMASLECADPQLRRVLQQSAVNCGEQAYEVWSYMNQHGYYQVPTMKEMTTQTMVNAYQPATISSQHFTHQAQTGQQMHPQQHYAGYQGHSPMVSSVQPPSYTAPANPTAQPNAYTQTTSSAATSMAKDNKLS